MVKMPAKFLDYLGHNESLILRGHAVDFERWIAFAIWIAGMLLVAVVSACIEVYSKSDSAHNSERHKHEHESD
jgi:Gpi18-like mannosyltransferase